MSSIMFGLHCIALRSMFDGCCKIIFYPNWVVSCQPTELTGNFRFLFISSAVPVAFILNVKIICRLILRPLMKFNYILINESDEQKEVHSIGR